MSKRNITYVKPDEPSFLKKLKIQAGFKEGPTVDTKKEDLGPVRDEDLLDTEEEQPTVVVLAEGDLTAEEAEQEKARLEKKAEETPADLNSRIVFKAPNKSKISLENPEKEERKSSGKVAELKDKKKSKKSKTSLLSFDEEEHDD